jgi:hypothetical protein
MKAIRRHLSYANVAATLALVLAASGGAVAATGGFTSGGKLQACVTGGGSLKLVKAGAKCRKGQKLVSWSQAGPAGPKGVAGAPGAPGGTGPAGASAVTLWAEVDAGGVLLRSSGVTNVVGNASGRFFTFNRDISKCAISASLNEGPAATVYAERSEETVNQVITKTVGEIGGVEKVEAGGVDLIVSC